jgi:putative methylase|tara:strand:+ start:1590 stop:2249 length:660 start_codon:yes stop_codon:yes gene_type:complete
MSKSESSNDDKRRQIGSKGALGVALSKLESFIEPKVRVEQYPTDAEIAAEVLWQVRMKGDFGKVSVDLGCGTGVLGIGLMLLGEVRVYMVDSDEKTLEQAKRNLEKVQSEYEVPGEAVFVHQDVKDFEKRVDLVVENPPFGVKNKHADKIFLEKAFSVGKIVYSFHKTESKDFIEKLSSENGFKVTDVWDFEFPLKATMKFHSRRIKRINVSCFRIEKK